MPITLPQLKQWSHDAIAQFENNDLVGLPSSWRAVYEAIPDYLFDVRDPDPRLMWMIEGCDEPIADVVHQLQRLKQFMLKASLADASTHEDLPGIVRWFDRAVLTMVEKASGKASKEHGLLEPYETIFWKARDGMYISTVEGCFIHANEALVRMLRFDSLEALLKMDISKDLYLKRSQRQVLLKHLEEDGFFDQHEFEFNRADGDVGIAIESCYLVKMPGGHNYIVGLMVDITEQKQSEKRIRDHQDLLERKTLEASLTANLMSERHERLFQMSETPTVMLDAETLNIIEVNRAFGRRFRIRVKSASKQSFKQLFGDEDWLTVFDRLSNLQNQSRFTVDDLRCRIDEDTSIPVSLRVCVLREDEGTRMYVQLTDLSEVERLRGDLAVCRQNMTQIFDRAKMGIAILDDTGKLIYTNKYLVAALNYSSRKLKGTGFLQTLFDREETRLKFQKYVNRILEGHHLENLEVGLVSKSGKVNRFLMQTMPWRDPIDESASFVAFLTDITMFADGQGQTEAIANGEKTAETLKRETETLQDQLDQLNREMAARKAFFEQLVERLRDPITAAHGFAGLLMRDLGDQLNQHLLEDIEIIQSNLSFLLSGIEKATELNQLDHGESQAQLQTVQVKSFLNQLFGDINMGGKCKPDVGFDAQHEILNDAWMIHTDPKLVTSLVGHLLDNAAKYTHRGEILLEGTVRDGRLILTLRDTGQGINTADIGRVFEPFFQSDTDELSGLGLGLAIADRLAESLGAKLDFTSKPKSGTKAELDLGPIISD